DSYDLETHTARLAAIWKFGENGVPGEVSAGFGAELARTDWTGVYIGAHAGGVAADLSSDTYTGAPGTVNPTPTGIFGGLLAGYNHQVDRYLLGLEADVSFVRANDMDGTSNGGGLFFEGDLRETYSVRARAGYLFDNTLLFATAGPAFATAGVDNQVAGVKFKANHFGAQVGGGLEHPLNDSLLLRAEYLYSVFGKESYTVVAGAASDRYALDAHAGRLALIWNFGTVR
ncbi:MAG: outer membrane beta-barrel protein, partial [Pseudomonadota bacterium]